MRRLLTPALAFAAFCVAAACASDCLAGILLPQQISVDANDLERFLADGSSQSSTGTSSPARRHSANWPGDQRDEPSSPLELAQSLPTGGSSSSTTSSPAPGGAVGSGVVVCLLNSTLALNDDSPLGTLAEDHGLSLPDPPGTDLLRPPQG